MKIEGFGVGCLEEIDQKLSKLEDIRQKTATEIPNLSVPLIEEAPLSELDTITIGDKYGMNPDDYVDVETASIPFSARVSNVLQAIFVGHIQVRQSNACIQSATLFAAVDIPPFHVYMIIPSDRCVNRWIRIC